MDKVTVTPIAMSIRICEVMERESEGKNHPDPVLQFVKKSLLEEQKKIINPKTKQL